MGEASDWRLLIQSRLPRTLAIVLTGAGMAMCGAILQVALKNRFVEPSMVGATQSAVLGMLLTALLWPQAAVFGKIAVAAACSALGVLAFMRLIKFLPPTDPLLIPLVGIVFGGIIDAATTFIAYQTETTQLVSVYRFGDFSSVLLGRYELLWLAGALCVAAYILADKLTVVGLGERVAVGLGLPYRRLVLFAIVVVCVVSAAVVISVGAIPFVGLVVPNIVSRLLGDNLRQSLPAVAYLGAASVLACDILGRVVRYPFEVPVTVVFGAFGAAVFLYLLLKTPRAA